MNSSSNYPNAISDAPASIQQFFERRYSRTPDNIAVRHNDKSITYDELYTRSKQLSQLIGIKFPGDRIIAVSTTRSIEMVIGVMAVLMSGKAYLPLDPAYPAERLKQIIDDSGVKGCLCLNEDKKLFEDLSLGVILPDQSGNNKTPAIQNDYSLAYILYTSGSTGKPKGVCMGQAPLVNLLQWQEKNSTAGVGTNTLQFAPLSFDVSFQEIFSTLTTGGTLILIDDDLRLDPFRLLHFIKDSSVNRIFLPFVALQQLAEVADANTIFPRDLTEVMTAGEQLKITPQVVQFFSRIKDCVLFNQYGPTEAHVVTQLVLKGDASSWPALPSIGTAIDNTEMLIVDDNMKILSNGETGELVISGICLAEGYLNRPDLTAEKFIDWTHPQKGRTRIYRTGDLARYMADGNIEFLGRRDDQVKIRGHRVELGEVEVALNKFEGIQQAVVVAREDIPGQKRLVAYLLASGIAADTPGIRKKLQQVLPDYMMPSAFMWVEKFPKTSSGKIDRKALPLPEIKRPELATAFKSPSSPKEKQIATLWCNLLLLDRIGVNDNFFELGGNSLLAVKTVVKLRQEHNYELPVTKLYQFPTVKGIADYLDHSGETVKKHSFSKRTTAQSGVAVIGMAGRFPGANTIDELWSVLEQGKETTHFFTDAELDKSISEKTRRDPDYVKARGIIDGAEQFDAGFFGINPKVAELMDPQQRIFLEVAWEVLEATGYLPEKHSSSIGVFAGCGNNTYYLNNVLSNRDLIERVGSFQVMTVNEKDYIATRTAYELNLKGPAVSVHSGCSTSLLAIAEAVENIRSGRCGLAIAGGVSITAPVNSGQFYEEGAMFSRDGHCRPFDKQAQGTVFSDGAGVVLLKDLDEAIKDGDTIYAVVKGFGYNNDGGGKGSFTAPSAEGQAGAIAQAIADAGIEPSSISYVETHGTATPLGDPIEIEGLKMAFGSQAKNQFCAIGSIKSNMGHLTAAAGVAGFIKTALSLHYRKLPASLHYNSPNPDIDFANSPFFVNTSLKNWDTKERRIAGVSSFGVGGTNVHVILEESESQSAPTPASTPPLNLITWSSKSEASRENYAGKLASYINQNKETDLSSLAYTLQSTRRDFNFRRFIIASDINDLSTKLSTVAAPSEIKKIEEITDEVAFVFPGQGSQYNNMGFDLYIQEPVFKNAVDECALILQREIGENIHKILYQDTSSADTRLNQTEYTQPALFTIEYALAKLWMSWGITPSAMMGHSIGEYVAAHLAGVFSLNDALVLLSARSRLMGSMPPGKMLSVQMGEQDLRSILPEKLSIAAINTSKLTVIAGREKDIEDFMVVLNEKGLTGRILKTSHAFHSVMMDPVLEPFLKVAHSISYNKPLIPVVSTLTGKWVSEAEITDPGYWATQIRNSVRFADALETICDDQKRVILEVGPGNIASGLARQQLGHKGIVTLQGISKGAEGESEYYSVLRSLGQLWLNGIQPDWKKIYHTEPAKLPRIPSYAFNRKRLWVEPGFTQTQAVNTMVKVQTTIPKVVVTIAPAQEEDRKKSVIGRIKRILEEASGIEISDSLVTTGFIEMGLDSLLLTQIAFTLKKQFNTPVSFRQLNEDYNNIDSLATYLAAQMPADTITTDESPTPDATDNPSVLSAGNTVMENNPLSEISRQLEILTKQLAQLQSSGSVNENNLQISDDNRNGSVLLTGIDNKQAKNGDSLYPVPPVPGARLGKDADNNPAWFIPDEKRPGKYVQIEFYEN